jgi:hypothetical protein
MIFLFFEIKTLNFYRHVCNCFETFANFFAKKLWGKKSGAFEETKKISEVEKYAQKSSCYFDGARAISKYIFVMLLLLL